MRLPDNNRTPWIQALLLCFLFASAGLVAAESPVVWTLQADVETVAVATGEDAADDAAIWIDAASPGDSLVIGTDKKSGLLLYDLDGKLVQELTLGRLNNVDIRQDVVLGDWRGDLIAASDRSYDRVVFLAMDRERRRLQVLGFAPAGVAQTYGICMHHGRGGVHVFVTGKDGDLVQMQVLAVNPVRGVLTQPLGRVQLPSQIEGCVADDFTGHLYVGEENRGIWRFPVGNLRQPQLLAAIGDGSGLHADVEGLAIFRLDQDTAWLIASSQGDDSFVAYRLQPFGPAGKFRIEANPAAGIDAVSNTDGIDVTAVGLGLRFPDGLLVVQDDENTLPDAKQNFKLVDLGRLLALLEAAR